MRLHTIIALLLYVCFYLPTKAQTGQYLPAGIDLHQHGNDHLSGNWRLVWSDEFDGTTLDQNKWVTYSQCNYSGDDQCDNSRLNTAPANSRCVWKDENVIVDGEYCHLVIKRENCSWGTVNCNYSAGQISSKIDPLPNMRNVFERGKFEARIKYSGRAGTHSNFWLWGQSNIGHEIDIAEYEALYNDKMMLMLHQFDYDNNTQSDGGIYYQGNVNYSADFHNYMVVWDKYFVYFYIDNVLKHAESKFTYFPTNDDYNGSYLTFDTWTTASGYYWNRKIFPPINFVEQIILHIFPGWDFLEQGSTEEPETIIDWVRVYQREECDEDEIITNPVLLPYASLSNPFLMLPTNEWTSQNSITLGTQDINRSWSNIIPRWGDGYYKAKSITMLHNFESYPASPLEDPNRPPGYFIYEAKECAEYDNPMVLSVPHNSYLDNQSQQMQPEFNNTITLSNKYVASKNMHLSDQQLQQTNSSKNNLLTVGNNNNLNISNPTTISIYPNPNYGYFTIEAPHGNYDIQIVNLLGVVVQRETIQNNTKKNITLKPELAAGNYMVNIKGNGHAEIKRITLVK